MTTLAITRRPIVLETQASAAMLTDILGRIASIRGRASAWGVENDLTRAEYLAGQSVEADFTANYFRDGFVEAAAPALLPGWAFTRTGAGTARTASGTVSPFATGIPRITTKGLLAEQASTNLLLRSQEFGSAPWSGAGITVASNVLAAPDGTMTADTLTANTATSPSLSQSLTLAATTTYAVSIYLRAGTSTVSTVQLFSVTSSANIAVASIAWTAGVPSITGTPTGTWTIQSLADGWYRITGVAATNSAPTPSAVLLLYPDAVGTGSVGFWGGQLEAGHFATAYVPTTSATVTRGAEAITLTKTSPNTGSVLVECELRAGVLSASQYLFDWIGNGERLQILRDTTGQLIVLVQMASQTILYAAVAKAGARTVKVAVTWGWGAIAAYVDGVEVGTSATTAAPLFTAVSLGSDYNDALNLDGYLRRVLFFDTPLSAAEALAITEA